MIQQEQTRYRKPRNHTDPRIPSIVQSTRSKSTISSLLSTFTPTPTTTDDTTKKKYFTSTRFRGLGCTAPAQVSVPAMIRTSANWEEKKARKVKKKKNCGNEDGISNGSTSSCLVVPDVWCGPGIGFSTDAASVDCVVSRRPVSGRGKVDGQRMNLRERRMVHPEETAYFDSGLDVFGSRHHRQHLRHGSPEGLAEIGNLVRLDDDRYREWRLDVDSMSYEELVELGDKIGYVSTGLREDEIRRCVTKTKMPSSSSSSTSTQIQCQWKCSICQEEYEGDDEIGKLECGHFYHIYCIKQWVAHKNTCPICKLPLQ